MEGAYFHAPSLKVSRILYNCVLIAFKKKICPNYNASSIKLHKFLIINIKIT